jgi:hypothetical protein
VEPGRHGGAPSAARDAMAVGLTPSSPRTGAAVGTPSASAQAGRFTIHSERRPAMVSVQPAGPTASDSYRNVERIGFGILMIGAPILMLGAAIFHPPHALEDGTEYFHASHDHTSAFYVSHTLFFLAAVLFVPAVVGLARLVHPTATTGRPIAKTIGKS